MIEDNNVTRILVFAAGVEMICFREGSNKPRSIYQYSNMAPRLQDKLLY